VAPQEPVLPVSRPGKNTQSEARCSHMAANGQARHLVLE
jgi:hypothetical protein